LDNAPSHPDVGSLQSDTGDIVCVYLPPNTTSLIQPMDQGVLKNIKRRYKQDLLRLLDHDSLNIMEFSKNLNIKDTVFMAANSWGEVEASTISKSWSKLLCIDESTGQDSPETGDNMDASTLFNDMDVPAKGRADWLGADKDDPGYNEYMEEGIVAVVREDNNDTYDVEYEADIVPPTVSHEAACTANKQFLPTSNNSHQHPWEL